MVDIVEVARRAGVSTATVSRALSGRGAVSPATRERVRAAAAELDYVVSAAASGLATGRTRNIGVLVPYLDRWFYSTVLSGVSAALMVDGYDITLYPLVHEPAARRSVFDTFLRRGRVDGVIAVTIDLSAQERERLADLGIPVVAIGGATPQLRALAVDDVGLARTAAEHLLALGHRTIGHIGADRDHEGDFQVPLQRRIGVEHALAAAGAPVRAELYEPGDFTVEGGRRAALQLLTRTPRPTALLAASDEMALGALLAAAALGLHVPDDLSVMGIDGHELAAPFDLTTVDQFPRAQGERAAAAIIAEITRDQGITAPLHEMLPYALTVRGSTAPPRRRSSPSPDRQV